MKTYTGPKSHIHLIARGLVIQADNIILCRMKDAKWYFLPGGHIEDGESAKTALLRELNEELGAGNYGIGDFVGACENIFDLDENSMQHEINIVYKVTIPEKMEVGTKEAHIEFISVPKKSLSEYKLLPATLKEGLLRWVKNESAFYEEIK